MNFISVYQTWEEHKAEMIKGLLRNEEIECYLSSQVSHSVYPIPVDGLGKIEIMVEEEDGEEARKIIDEFFPESENDDG